MNYILFDSRERTELLPLTFTRPVCDLRIGTMTIREKWETALKAPTSTFTENHLAKKFPLRTADDNLWINGSTCPDSALTEAISQLSEGERLVSGSQLLAVRHQGDSIADLELSEGTTYNGKVLSVEHLWDIFRKNGEALEADFKVLTKGRDSEVISSTNTIIGNGQVFLASGARAEACILNTDAGPIYLSEDSEVMEGSLIRGPFSLGQGSKVKMGARIYGATTIGPQCKVGGEVSNSVIIGYSNKGHDGFLGNSVIGEWCNLGASTNNSNLKNNYDKVKIWNYSQKKFVTTDQQFFGLVMGDHAKSGISTMFNTGTVVGVSANVFGAGFPRNFIPSFSWGGTAGFSEYRSDKALRTAELVMNRRNVKLDDMDRSILTNVFELTRSFRT